MKKLTPNQRQIAAWAGILAPILFVGIFTLEGFLRPGYEPLKTYISALSLGPRGWIQMANFVVLGVLLLLFAWGIAAEFKDGKASRGGPILLAILGVLFLVSGPFVMDPTGTPTDQMSVHGMIHGIAGGIVFLLMPITCFVFLRRFRADPKWQFLQGWTLGLGTFDALAVILFTISSKAPSLQSTFGDWQGLIQRAALVPFMIWLLIFALGFRQRVKQGSIL
jgi:hypothetical protein